MTNQTEGVVTLSPHSTGKSHSQQLSELTHLAYFKEKKPTEIPQVVVHKTQGHGSACKIREAQYIGQSNLRWCRARERGGGSYTLAGPDKTDTLTDSQTNRQAQALCCNRQT